MRSYSFPTTIALLCLLSASTTAVPSTQRELLYNTFDILESNEGGMPGLVWSHLNAHGSDSDNDSDNNKEGIFVDARAGSFGTIQQQAQTTSLSGAAQGLSDTKSRLRGATIAGSGNAWKHGKALGKGGKKGCKKDKKHKHGGGKGGKGSGGTKGLFKHKNPTASTNTNVAPTPSPVSMDDLGDECPEGTYYWHGKNSKPTAGHGGSGGGSGGDTYTRPPVPTFSPAPTVSPEPTATPTRSPAPTTSPKPTNSPDPTASPTRSPAPTITPSPTATPSPTQTGGGTGNNTPGQVKSFCTTMPAAYDGDFIDIWYPGSDKGRTREGTAALSSVVDVPVDAKDTDGYKVTVTLAVLGDELGDDLSVVETSLDEAITPPMALHIVGCPRKARAAAEDYYWENKNSRRGLDEVEENPSQLVVMKNWSCVKDSCNADNRCDVKCSTPINYMGDLGFILVENSIAWSLKEYLSMMDDVTLWYPRQQITDFEIEEFDTSGPNIDGLNDAVNQQSARKMKAGPFIGAATGLLALLLLLVLFVRRRNRFEETVSHLKLDEEDDETYYNGSEASTPNNKEYNTRDTHIVGEADSVVSHWTGYTGNNRTPNYEVEYDNEYNQSSLVRGISTDVHQCSSATCEICAKNRQAGLNFVPTGIEPVRSTSIPSDASRGYAAEDTVEL